VNRDIFDVDPELADLLKGEPDLIDLAGRLRDAHPQPRLDEHFRAHLRAQLMRAAPAELRPRGWRRVRRALALPSGVWLAGTGAGLGLAMAGAAAAIVLYSHSHSDVVTVGLTASNVAEKHTVDPDNVIEISFSQPMDRTAVVKGIKIQPATSFSTQWKDDKTLVIVPAHHLAANTPYTVRIAPQSARDIQGNTATAPIVIAFGTKPAPSATPAVSPAPPPELELHTIGSALAGGLVIAPDGGVSLAAGAVPPPRRPQRRHRRPCPAWFTSPPTAPPPSSALR